MQGRLSIRRSQAGRALTDKGSSPIEAVALMTLLLLPIAPALSLYQHLSDSLAAESIARHALRAALLDQEKGVVPSEIGRYLEPVASSWGKKISSFEMSCGGQCEENSLLSLRVQIGSAWAIQTAGLEPN